jgi:methylated-DNA-[protein]-cysteine S-methyltransferase
MQYVQFYDSPLGKIVLTCDDVGLTGLRFDDGTAVLPKDEYETVPHPHHAAASRWLDDYFARKDPGFLPPLHFLGTPFQNDVWEELLKIPYGQTRSYGQIAAAVARKMGVPRMAAQAVGGAVGRNDIVIIVPCHRVIGADGNLTGYTGGLEKKIALLALEGTDLSRMYLPKKRPASAEETVFRNGADEEKDPEGESDMKTREVFAKLREWGTGLTFNRTVQMTPEEGQNPPAFAVHMTMSAVKCTWKIARKSKFLWKEKWNFTVTNDTTGEKAVEEEYPSSEAAAERLMAAVTAFENGE